MPSELVSFFGARIRQSGWALFLLACCFLLIVGIVVGIMIQAAATGRISQAVSTAPHNVHDPFGVVVGILGTIASGMVGAAGALLGVWITAAKQEAREAAARRLQAFPFAVPVASSLKQFRYNTRDYTSMLRYALGESKIHGDLPEISGFPLTEPSEIKTNHEKLYLLGLDAGAKIFSFLAMLERYNQNIFLLEFARKHNPTSAIEKEWANTVIESSIAVDATAKASYDAILAVYPDLSELITLRP